ncbi:MAG: MutH/Sau3AI family endonuclease [Candidatus Kapaibacterium sp.]|jgi:DNA mismatch repair protein MutH
MKLVEAKDTIEKYTRKPFSEIFEVSDMENIIRVKGLTGLLLEKLIKLPASSNLIDFEDGELKTNKCNENGKPLETMYISQISSRFDELLDSDLLFSDSWIFHKINRLLYVPVVKTSSNPSEWYFLNPIQIDLSFNENLKIVLEDDFNRIKKGIRDSIQSGDQNIHTTNGEFLQIRTKDSKPYNPIYSKELERYVSNKNFAFYFRTQFMSFITGGNL